MPAARPETAPQTTGQWLRVAGNAINLTTPLGLIIAAVGRAELRLGPRGLILGEHYRLPFPIAGAFTVGDVVITPVSFAELHRRYPELLTHEEQHCWQYFYSFGLPFFFAYPIAMVWSLLRTGDRAAGNVFEVHAGLDSGGYHRFPTRPIHVGVRDLAGRVKRALRSRRS